jgi:hypothetical protein
MINHLSSATKSGNGYIYHFSIITMITFVNDLTNNFCFNFSSFGYGFTITFEMSMILLFLLVVLVSNKYLVRTIRSPSWPYKVCVVAV